MCEGLTSLSAASSSSELSFESEESAASDSDSVAISGFSLILSIASW